MYLVRCAYSILRAAGLVLILLFVSASTYKSNAIFVDM